MSIEIIGTICILIGLCGIGILTFFKQTREKQVAIFKEWLRFSVVNTEQLIGSTPGQLKLRYLYNVAYDKFPKVIKYISFEDFSKYVDEALQWAEETLDEES